MPLRIIILILALIAFLSASTGGWLYYYSYREAAFERSEANAQAQLELVGGHLADYLSEHKKSIKTLAKIKEIRNALETTNLETIFQANQILDLYKESLEARVCYLLDIQGTTLCSSNRNQADSFVGSDYSFRPYFTTAIAGSSGTYLALGVDSMQRGIYYSHPVYDSNNAHIIGIVVIKASVEFVEETLFSQIEALLLLTGPREMIFITNEPSLRSKLLWHLEEDTMDTLIDSRQFGYGSWE